MLAGTANAKRTTRASLGRDGGVPAGGDEPVRVAEQRRLAVLVELHHAEAMRLGAELAPWRRGRRSWRSLALGVADLEGQPDLVRVDGAGRELVADVGVLDDHVDGHFVAGGERGGLHGQGLVEVAFAAHRDDVDAHDAVDERLLQQHGLGVAGERGERGVRREEPVRADDLLAALPRLRREIVAGGDLRLHVAVVAEPLRRVGRVDRAGGLLAAVRERALLPAVEVVLAAQPALAVDVGVQRHLVAARAQLGRLGGLGLHGGLVRRDRLRVLRIGLLEGLPRHLVPATASAGTGGHRVAHQAPDAVAGAGALRRLVLVDERIDGGRRGAVEHASDGSWQPPHHRDVLLPRCLRVRSTAEA